MADIGETTILEEGNVKITTLRAIIGTDTYELANITSAKLTIGEEPSALLWAISFFGPVIVCWLLSNLHWGSFLEFLKYGFYLCGGLVVLILLGELFLSSDSYKVDLEDGPGIIFTSNDKNQAQRIVDAINDAISRKGQQVDKPTQSGNNNP